MPITVGEFLGKIEFKINGGQMGVSEKVNFFIAISWINFNRMCG